jgi:acyl carrier protein
MDSITIKKRIYDILAEASGFNSDEINDRMILNSDFGFDSLDKIELFFVLEDEFNIKEIRDSDFRIDQEKKTVLDLIDFIKNENFIPHLSNMKEKINCS